jgi:hypothetical protein
MDFNVMCSNPTFSGLCRYIFNYYIVYQSANQNGGSNPFSPFNPDPRPNPTPINPIFVDDPDACKPGRFSNYIGALYDPKSDTFKLKDGSVSTLTNEKVGGIFRIIGPTTPTSKDLGPKRLNVYYTNPSKKSEDPGTVTGVNCG